MEATKDQSTCPGSSGGSKLRYPLRSSGKLRDGKPVMDDASASRRGRSSSSVSQSVSALELSAKDKSVKPPRRLSIPMKSTFSPRQASAGNITPISETRITRSNNHGRSDTPSSDASISKSSSRRKFNVLSSVSYWLTQIKISESASKHSVSLGFFKLALESGTEPLQRMREELKSYVRKYNLLAELEEPARDLLQRYDMLQDLEQLKLSENDPQLLEAGSHTSNQDLHISGSTRSGNLKPKSLISNTLTVAESNRKQTVQKRVPAARASNVKNPGHSISMKDGNDNSMEKKSSKKIVSTKRVESKGGSAKVKSSKKSTGGEGDSLSPEDVSNENKENIVEDTENMGGQSIEGDGLKEEISTI